MDNQTKKKVCLLLCITAQFGIITALVLQGRRLRQLYDFRDKCDELLGSMNDLEIRFAYRKHIPLFISAMVFGSLGQLFAWTGLLYLSPWLLIFSGLSYLVFEPLCLVIHLTDLGGASEEPAFLGYAFGLVSCCTTGPLIKYILIGRGFNNNQRT